MKNQNLLYRKADIKDVEQIAKLVSSTIGTCNLQKNHSITENNIVEITDSISNYFVCEYQNSIIGVCGISDILKSDNYNLCMSDIKEILYFAVDRKYQRKGIGTKLLSLCINNETHDILYEGWGDNGEYINSKFLLEKLGFKLYRDLGMDYYKNNGYCPFCVNKDKECYSCLSQLWIKNKEK